MSENHYSYNRNPQKPLKGALLAEVGLLEAGFVIVALVVIFGTLNYFNVLRIDYAFSFLSFLPHKTTTQPSQPSGKINRTLLNRTFTYIGVITNIIGNRVTIQNKGSSSYFFIRPTTLLNQPLATSSAKARRLMLSQDIKIGDYVEVTIAQTRINTATQTQVTFTKISKQTYDAISR